MDSTASDFDSLSEFITPSLDSLPPLPPSDFTFSDLLQKQHTNHDSFFLESSLFRSDSLFLDSSLSLLNHHNLTESTHFQQLLHENNIATTQFLHLPDLKSIEQTTTTTTTAAFEETKKTKPFLSLSPFVDAKRRRKILGSSSTSGTLIENNVTRRKKISDKIRSLEKLMPWETKMSLAIVLEESYKYIKFLQSQIDVLRWMPLDSVYNTAGEVGETDLLKSLTRQQILQVLANSPGSRNLLATRGVCVFSYEQLLSLKTMSRNL